MGNILDILNQIKQFIVQEKGSYFSLFVYLILGFAIVDQLLPFFHDSLDFGINPLLILIIVLTILLTYRYTTRRLRINHKKVNIGIAQMDILNISTKDHLNAEQKLQISTEVVNYVYNRLSHMKQTLKLDNHLNFLRIQPRVSIDYANASDVPKDIGIDIVTRGTIRYDQEKIYINTKFALRKEVSSAFFQKLIDDLNAYPELDFDFSSPVNLEFDKFIHEITYISIIYRGLELINNYQYEQAEEILTYGIHKLNDLYNNKADQSVNRGDKEASKIEVLMYFVLAKTYFNRANTLLANFDYKNKANDKLDQCADAIEHALQIIKKYLKDHDFDDISEQIMMENSYIRAMNKLSRTKNKTYLNKQLDEVNEVLKEQYRHNLVYALIEARFTNFADAKKHYEEALVHNPRNAVVLRGLGLIEYDLKNYDKAYEHLHTLYDISPLYVFNDHLYDIKLQKRLINLSLRKRKIGGFLLHTKNLITYRYKNKNKLKNEYIL